VAQNPKIIGSEPRAYVAFVTDPKKLDPRQTIA